MLVTSDGVVKLLTSASPSWSTSRSPARAGPLGTVAYMSPEQVRGTGGSPDRPLVAGRRVVRDARGATPYSARFRFAVALALQNTAPPPVALRRPDVPPALEQIVSTALATSPGDRSRRRTTLKVPCCGSVSRRRYQSVSRRGSSDQRPADKRDSPTNRRLAPPGRGRCCQRQCSALPVIEGRHRRRRRHGSDRWRCCRSWTRVRAGTRKYFSDGLAEELIATLERIEGIRVASRTSSFSFKDQKGLDVPTIAKQLGVAAVVEGGVRREGGKLRITARLVNAADGYALWSDTYNRDAGDAFAIQQEIARAIAQTLRAKLVGPVTDSQGVPLPDAAAYELYLKGRRLA